MSVPNPKTRTGLFLPDMTIKASEIFLAYNKHLYKTKSAFYAEAISRFIPEKYHSMALLAITGQEPDPDSKAAAGNPPN